MGKLLQIFLITYILATTCGYELKQVLILSRHNIRTPLSKDLPNISSKPWPHWNDKQGDLTPKGARLEGFMGKYFSKWLLKEGILKDKCPNEDTFFAYANNKQRTKASAQAFVDEAFPNCNVTVHHQKDDELDPNFSPHIHNSSEIFQEIAKKAMTSKLLALELQSSFTNLQNILDYSDSPNCKLRNSCDLVKDATEVKDVEVGEEPEVSGPLHIGNAAVDTFKMEYYEGFPLKDIAWGLLLEERQWKNLMDLNFGYHDVRFNATAVAKDIATPLLIYIRNVFKNEEKKVTLLMGHDANIYTVLCSLNFKPYTLLHQHEKTPVGGKLVFQKWWDEDRKRDLLKIEYVYQTSEQLRNAVELTSGTPPQRLLMGLHDCATDENGFCSWDDFISLLNSL